MRLPCWTVCLTTIALATVPPSAGAQPPGGFGGGFGPSGGGPPGGMLRRFPAFAALDLDDDGELSIAELEAAPASLVELDRDGDGGLSQDELRPSFGPGPGGGGRGGGRRGRGGGIGGPAMPTSEAVPRFMEHDANGDGKLTEAELPSQLRSVVRRADQQGDGDATADEIRALLDAESGGGGDPAGPGGGGFGPPAGMLNMIMRSMPLIVALDADRDGVISAEEITASGASLKPLDQNGDGRVTEPELRPDMGAMFGGGSVRGRGRPRLEE